jgi:hypothetical protein
MRTVTLESAIAATAKMGLRNPYSPRKGWRSIGTSRGPAKWVEDACGNRDQEHVVGKGPEQVLLDVSNSGFTEIYGLRHPAHVCADERGLRPTHKLPSVPSAEERHASTIRLQ